ncbi:MAG TPA: nucleotidyltransferase domain-containing protein [Candidatus Acidoferrales bacterium]|nr:nucleotidyltransferase domain-containing protein [Candidatus Acidoferrales bacterium]
MEELLESLKQRLLEAAKDNLKAIVLYGSAAAGEYHRDHSDLNVLCIVERVGAAELEALHDPVAWWRRKGYASPQVFTLAELLASADIFAIELLDMKARHRMIYGEDFFDSLKVPMHLHKQQVERELRTSAIRLRQGILAIPPRDRVVVGLMDASISAFVVLFRHALVALGDSAPDSRREVIERIAHIVGASPEAFFAILDVREGKRKSSELGAAETLKGFVSLVERVTDEVDRRLAGK